jgi:hypothetical protein
MPAATTSVNGYLTSTDWTTFNNKGSGTVTSVTGTAPVVSSGGATPAISMAAATTSVNGYLTSTDWTTFNNKGSGSVTSVGFTGGIITVATPTTTPAFTIAGTSGGIPYFSSASTWASSAALAAGSLVLGGGAGITPATTATGTGVVTALGVNTGTAGAFVVNGGALGTPSSGTVTNLTGTASININGTVGATTPTTGSFTTMKASTGAAVGGATPGAGGLAFPATAVAVADPNTLDDYEEYTAASAACTGAITTAAIWKATKVGNVVTLTLPATTGTASASPRFVFGVSLPAKFCPAANTAFLTAWVLDAGAAQTLPGLIYITTGGAISVGRDGTNSANFTAALTAGLITDTGISWTI